MKTTHAFNFFIIGMAMCFSPAFWPEFFSGEVNANDTSEVWMLIMGVIQMSMGAWTMGLNEVPRWLHSLSHWEPVPLDFSLPDVSWVLPDSFYAGLNEDDDVRVALALQQQLRLGQA
jgi:hypothetical protein